MLAGPVLVTGTRGWVGSLLVAGSWMPAPTALFTPGRDELHLAAARQVEAFLTNTRPRTILHLASSTARGGAPSRAWPYAWPAGLVHRRRPARTSTSWTQS